MTIRSLLFFTVTFLLSLPLSGQRTIGTPKIINFSHEQMGAGTQNWNITQDSLGVIYIANNGGLATYNAREWKIYGLPNKTIVRSVFTHPSGRIYVGGQDIFGYFFPDKSGALRFHDESIKLPKEHRAFGDVWSIAALGDTIFYRTSRKIFEYRDNKFHIHVNGEQGFWSNLTEVNNRLYAYDYYDGLLYYNKGKFTSLPSSLKQINITEIIDYGKDTLLLSTLKNGLFLYADNKTSHFPVHKKITASQIYSAVKINDNTIALGTVANGIFMIDKHGRSVGQIATDNGLTNNIILSLFLDKDKNLWAGLDDGVSLINTNSAIQTIYPVSENRMASYAVHVYGGNLYVGASDGLYATKLTLPHTEDLSYSKNSFIKVPQTEGQVWSIDTVDNKLMMGHHEGAVEIREKSLIKYQTPGAWIYRKLPNSKNTVLGTYNGLYFLTENNNGISIVNSFSKNVESLRFLEVDVASGIIWASHPYRGIYRMKMSPDFITVQSSTLFTSKDGLPTDLNNFVYKVDNEIVFATEEGIYKFDDNKQEFVRDNKFANTIGNAPVAYMKQDNAGRIWFVSNELPGMLDMKKNNIIYFNELRGKLVGGFYHFYPLNDKNIFMGSNSGVIHLNLEKYNASPRALNVSFNRIVMTARGRDSVIHNGYFVNKYNKISAVQPEESIVHLSPKSSSVRFEFIADNFIDNNTLYTYKLEGFDEEWSVLSLKNNKDYTNLPHGKYTFKVKAKDNFGNESSELLYTFYIQPFWYQTNLAKLFYALVIMMSIFLFVKFMNRKIIKQKERFEKQQQQQKYLHDLEIEHNEREIINLKNQNLETEIRYKNKELATITMNHYKRGRLLTKLKEDIGDASKKITDRDQRKSFHKVIKQIEEAEKQNNDWEQFSIHFDDVHNNFLKNMKEKYPDLSPADLKICAYLKINLSSKEIAQILNISLKGVEVARYRLRKKLGIETDVNLVSFLNDIE